MPYYWHIKFLVVLTIPGIIFYNIDVYTVE